MPQPNRDTLVRMLSLCDQMAAAEDLLESAENDEQRAVGLQAMEGAKELQDGVEGGMEFLGQDD